MLVRQALHQLRHFSDLNLIFLVRNGSTWSWMAGCCCALQNNAHTKGLPEGSAEGEDCMSGEFHKQVCNKMPSIKPWGS